MARTARTTLRVEPLEDRVTPAYTATFSGFTSTWTGSSTGGTGDILTFSRDAGTGNLIHNRFVAGDTGFNSAQDFDSTVAGDQVLAASAASEVRVTTGGSSLDEVRVGGSVGGQTAAASQLLAVFIVTAGAAGQAVLVDDSSATTGRTFTFASNGVTTVGVGVSFAGQAFGDGITLNTGTGNDTVNLTSVLGIGIGVEPRAVVNDGGSDTVTVGSAAGSLDGFAGQPITVTGIGGTTAVVVNDAGDADGDTYTVTAGGVRREDGANDATVTTSGTGVSISLNTGGGADTVVMAAGATLNGGTLDAGAGVDALDYSAFTTPVVVNLGFGSSGLAAALDGNQANPAQTTPAAGTAAVSNYNATSKTFDLTLTVTDLNPATVTGLSLHSGGVGVNGPQLIDLLALGALVPAGTGFTLTLTGVALGAANEAAFLGGQTYLRVGTAAAGSLIRGQVFTTGNLNLAAGTATGTGGITGVENVTGGSAADSLVGSFVPNVLSGLGGNDVLVGGPGAGAGDTFLGGADDDVMVWSNGDGSDVMDGGAGTDTVAVNGNVTGNDVFTVGANGTRIDFDRTSAGPFSLDIGTVETLVVNGVGGDDSFAVNALAGVADLAAVQLNGFAGADTFAAPAAPAGITVTARGGAGNDTFTVGGPSLDAILGAVNVDGGGNDAAPTTTQTGSAGPNTLPTGDTIVLDDAGDPTANTYTLTVTDLIRNGQTPARFARVETIRLNAGTGGDTFTVDALALANTVVSGGGGDDTFTLNVGAGANARLDGDAGADTFTVSGSGTASVAVLNGGAENDAVNIVAPGGSLDNISGAIVVDGGGHAAAPTTSLTAGGVTNTLPVGDTLTFNDVGDASNNTYALAAGALTRPGIPDVTFAAVETVVLNAASGKNTVTVSATGPSTTTTVNGDTAADTITVTTTGAASNTAVNGGGGTDTFTVNGSGVGSVTQMDGGAAADTLSVPTAGSTTPSLTTATGATGVSGAFTFGDRGPVGFAAVEAVNPLVTSAAATTFTEGAAGAFLVTAAGAPAATFTVSAGALPAGVTLSAAGVLSGTPTEAGTFAVTITAANGASPDATQAFTLTVKPNGDRFAVATGPGTPVRVKVFAPDGAELFTLAPFGDFAGGATVATGDVTGDGIDDVAVGAGAGGGPHVKLFDGATGAELRSFFAYAAGFAGGVFVGLGDVTGDGLADVVTGVGTGGSPHVKVFDGQTLLEVFSFFAFDDSLRGGLTVRAGDVDGDGRADIVTGAGPGGAPHIKVFSGRDLSLLQSFFADDPTSRDGVFVGVANLAGDTRAEVVAGLAGRVKVFGSVAPLLPYIEQDNFASFAGGVRTSVAAIRLDDGIIAVLVGAAPGTKAGPHVQFIDVAIDGATSRVRNSFFAFDPAFTGGVAVG
ncbi:beta strand repeat-containing protein [Urbifossiella limnaea]|uniref:Bifunctional hemolysin/adenylate cyclase n=1 Tax=Urbifossiella limnaea TaxID=2528023 RepID=A0A517XZB8_9BACT|nr:putative Ig domain-containing protein [Urbifossiella limnaea]QDU22851.1 Bifunctional hemolysin/adenylate cyclase precursor [Urbifossiella limnaea]